MAVSVNWGTSVISIPKADLTLISGTKYQYDVNTLRTSLNGLMDDLEGMPFTKTHIHNTSKLLGGITYARVLEILAPYTVEFEDGLYTVNLFGLNHNVLDVTIENQVSVTTANSAGLVVLTGLQERQDYGGYVLLDAVNGTAATVQAHPWGTSDSPVDNFADAAAIAAAVGIDTIRVATVPGTPVDLDVDVGGLRIESLTGGAEINLAAGNDVSGTVFTNCRMYGAASASSDFYVNRCVLFGGMTGLRGIAWECSAHENAANYTLEYAADFDLHSLDSGVPGTSYPILAKASGAGAVDVQVRGLRGGLGVAGVQTGDSVSVDVISGNLTIEASVTGGTFKVRGVGEAIVQSGTVDTLDTDGYLTPGNVTDIHKMLGLDATDPMTIAAGGHTSTGVNVTITDNGNGSFTLTRQ